MSQTAPDQSDSVAETAAVASAAEAAPLDPPGNVDPQPDNAASDAASGDPNAGGGAPTAAALAADLPAHTRSLFRVAVPVSVNLAHKRESVREIVEMAPGSILTFDKGCVELLELAIGQRVIAQGEAVKVGDKFGFRVVKIVPPEEQFRVVAAEAQAQALAGRAPTVVNLAGS